MSNGTKSIQAWALVLPLQQADALASLRLLPGLEVAAFQDRLWLRGTRRDQALDVLLDTLPATHRFHWVEGQRLQPLGSRLATDCLPDVTWQPLQQWLRISLQCTSLPPPPPAPHLLQLVRSIQSQQPNAILCKLQDWTEWCVKAPAVRMNPLRFAASAHGKALILGAPPPSLPGRFLVEEQGVVVPAGLSWDPPVSPVTVRRVAGAGEGNVLFWDERGLQVLVGELFVAASRAAARATCALQDSLLP